MSKAAFRTLVILELLIAIISLVFELFFPNTLVEEVNFQILEVAATGGETGEMLENIVVSASSLLYLVAFVGLLMFRNWGRILYVASYIIILPSYYINGLWLYSETATLFNDHAFMLGGFIVALIYFSPVKDHFEPSKG
ncbi:hypothetical protein [Ferrimonas sp. YFM]|uniref:hypothetical protein n=1 Tax=Ferrimonas sp. YFM TaxID=3028878 RepID=UPI0025737621|nr:hypothetical protein [Ferrimonas sp. YFM]BDY05195.1 hypothetical protein F0521_22360 [Ferrimonas sp. YFM]